jgi:hypothetical protein
VNPGRPRAAAALVVMVLAGCATEVDPEIPTAITEASTVTTEFVVTGSTDELLDQLLAEAAVLSEAIVQNEGQRDIVGRVDVIWAAARPDVEEASPDSVLAFDRAVAMLHTGVDRRRPADADKAYTNLAQLVAALP